MMTVVVIGGGVTAVRSEGSTTARTIMTWQSLDHCGWGERAAQILAQRLPPQTHHSPGLGRQVRSACGGRRSRCGLADAAKPQVHCCQGGKLVEAGHSVTAILGRMHEILGIAMGCRS